MLFNTLEYAWFLALVFIVTWLLVERRLGLVLPWIALSGYVLAATWSVLFPAASGEPGMVEPTASVSTVPVSDGWVGTLLLPWGLALAGLILTGVWLRRLPRHEAPPPRIVAAQLLLQLGALTFLTMRAHGLDPFSYGLSLLNVPVVRFGLGTWVLFALGCWLSFLWLRAKKVRLLFVLLASYVFYAHWDYRFLPLIWGSSTADWWLGKKIDQTEDPRARKLWLLGTVAINLGVLGFFKYFNFGIDSARAALTALGAHPPDIALRVALPVGISFFTFESMSYVIDVYRKELRSHDSYVEYLSFVAFFPHLVAGPIVRPRDLLPQLAAPGRFVSREASEGLFLIAMGLGKKIIVGDYLALNLVDRVFDAPAMYSAVETYAAIVGYALQIYCDFSGYTDIAIGSALLLGIRFPLNFDSPYKAHNIVDFWRRWHISLSTWLRDYLYIPLGGNRKGRVRTYVNLMLTMVLGGLWHGAAWTFVVWGFLHGAALAINKWFQEASRNRASARTARTHDSAATHGSVAATQGSAPGAAARNSEPTSAPPGSAAAVTHDSVAPAPGAAPAATTHDSAPTGTRTVGDAAAQGTPPSRAPWGVVRHVLSVFLTVHFVCACWVFFRAKSFEHAQLVFTQLATGTTHHQNLHGPVLGILALGVAGHYVPDKWFQTLSRSFIAAPWPVQGLLLAAVAWLVRQMASTDAVPFVYFQF